MNPRYPVYIVSKGRYTKRPTADMLTSMGVDFYIIVEASEYEDYCNVIDSDKVLILPQYYKDDYDTFWEKSDTLSTGPGPARNFAWTHSIENGFDRHWVLDDNIENVYRFNNNIQVKCLTGTPFYIAEEFTDRYENISIAGLGYSNFAKCFNREPAVRWNTRIYSCLLIKNDIDYRWRGRYNEDTDLSLRVLKDGGVTAEFNIFLQDKMSTTKLGGGNTKEFYAEEGTVNKSLILYEMHPDVCRLDDRWGRAHHVVNYKPFKYNRAVRRANLGLSKATDNFGLIRVAWDKEKGEIA